MVIAILGAGASGMAAALSASEAPDAQVILLERQARVGRKLGATGNGRCNLTNIHATERGYHGADVHFSDTAIRTFDPKKTLDWFRFLGLYTVTEPSGRVYPYSDQANSVVDVLRFALQKPNISLKLGFEAEKAKKTEHGFCIFSAQEVIECDRLIVACGGLAGTKLGGSMSGYQILRSLGHTCTRLRPTLVQLRSPWQPCASLKGVRANCKATILHDGTPFAESTGELQFTEYGLSGPVMFEISRDVCAGKGEWLCRLDMLPDMLLSELTQELMRRRATELPSSELLTGMLHNRLGRVITQQLGIAPYVPIAQLEDDELIAVAHAVKALDIPLSEPMGMDSAQVTAGGIVTAEFDEHTMQSRIVPNLYACGEVLDVDGDCGGYNLQWAWSSGRMAGLHAGGLL